MNVVIVGAGPVGLYLGCLLRQQDITCTILERRLVRSTHSRSIGIHPPALRRLEALGVVSELVEQGIAVRSGVGLLRGRTAGTLSFEYLKEPFNFVLAVPQHITEVRLETRFLSLGGILERGLEVVGMRQEGERVVLTWSKSGHISDRTADRVIACDGRRSAARDLLEIPLSGSSYADHYVMGDFPDTTDFENQAAIYLDRKGVVECFPLPDGIRRWVARIDRPVATAHTEIDTLVRIVSDRTSIALPEDQCSMHSSFTAERFEAERFFVGGIALAGDAAHVISPIGGQGMNLGWMDADWLAGWFERGAPLYELDRYESERKRSFRRAAWRAEMNMFMGRSGSLFPLRWVLAKAILSRPFQRLFARLFTMDGV